MGVLLPDTIGWISTIGVDPAYQHQGIARKLSEEFVTNLRSIGVTFFTRWSTGAIGTSLNSSVPWGSQGEAT